MRMTRNYVEPGPARAGRTSFLRALLAGLALAGGASAALPELPRPAVHRNQVAEAVFTMPAYVNRLARDISAARSRIYLDQYFLGGSPGRRLAHALAARKAEGLDVRVLIDAHMGTIGKLRREVKQVVRLLEERGVPVRKAVTRPGTVLRPRVADHHKLAVIDGQVAWVGGTNISDVWERYNDLMVRVHGSLATDVEQQFLFDWALTEEPDAAAGLPDIGYPGRGLLEADSREGRSSIRMVGTGPGRRSFEAAMLNNIRAAARSIEVQVHQLNHEEAIDELIRAHHRGVAVRIFLDPSNMDNLIPLVKKGPRGILNAYAAQRFAEAGVPVRFIKVDGAYEAFHMKLGIFDGQVLQVGTANWDRRAAEVLTETVLEVAGGPAVTRVRGWFDRNWEHHSEPPAVGYFARVVNWLMRKLL